jgi:hypothetical protein
MKARPFVEIPLPEGVATDSTELFGASIGPHFGETFATLADTRADKGRG